MPPDTRPGYDERLSRVRFRRALALLVMTLFAPGSAQLVAGRRGVGRFALRVWVGVVVVASGVVLLGLVWHGFAFWLVADTVVLGLLRVALMGLAVGWALLFVDAWRLGQPLGLRRGQRLTVMSLNGLLCLSVAGALLFASHIVGVQRDFIVTTFGAGGATAAEHGRYNVLLIGGDSGATRTGLRTDSLTVASIDEETGHTVLFGLPRNMANFAFPEGSVMAAQFPDGFTCDGCYLNGLSTWAADHADLFEEYDDPGIGATIEGVEGITGLSINYYAMVNLKGFRRLVDAVGGVELNVRDTIPIGVGEEATGYIEPGVQKLDGLETLWFARSREGADDYSRMARQKCVMSAMLDQLSPRVVVTEFEEITQASRKVISTDLPASELDRFMELALKAKAQPMRTVSFVPPLVDTSNPDLDAIQDRVEQAIEPSSARGGADPQVPRAGRSSSDSGAAPGAATTGGSVGSLSEGYAANDASNLADAC